MVFLFISRYNKNIERQYLWQAGSTNANKYANDEDLPTYPTILLGEMIKVGDFFITLSAPVLYEWYYNENIKEVYDEKAN